MDTNKAAATVAGGDLILMSDISNSNILKKVTAQSIADLAAGGANTIAISYENDQNTTLTDLTTFFLGKMGGLSVGQTSFAHIPLPAGTLRAVHYNSWTTNTLGVEVFPLVFVHAGGTLEIADDFVMNARNINRNFTGLSEVITEGNSYFSFLTPNYATNPNCQLRITIIIEV